MFRQAVLILCLVSLCSSKIPIYEGRYFQAFQVEDFRTNDKRQEIQEIVGNQSRSYVEVPYNRTVPTDNGSADFGDIEYYNTRKNGELIIRDTIVNQNRNDNVLIVYNRTLPGYYIEDFRIFNVGRQRGFTRSALIVHYPGYVECEILVPAFNTVRIFVEIYIGQL